MRSPTAILAAGRPLSLVRGARPRPVDLWELVRALETAEGDQLPPAVHAWLEKRWAALWALPDGAWRVTWECGASKIPQAVCGPSLFEAVIGALRKELGQ